MKRLFKAGVLAMLVALPLMTQGEAANNDITVKLENTKFIGKQKVLEIKPSQNYRIQGSTVQLYKGGTYTVQPSGSRLVIYKGTTKVLETLNGASITLIPLNAQGTLAIKNYAPTSWSTHTAYLGTMELKLESGFVQAYNTLPLEDYLKGVVPYEMANDWGDNKGLEALKAQAVTARSYVLANNYQHAAFILDTTQHQVYGGYVSTNTHSNLAVKETTGEYLTYDGKPVVTYYSSSNGGYTETNDHVWNGSRLPYLTNQADSYDAKYTARQAASSKQFSIGQIELLEKMRNYAPLKKEHPNETLMALDSVIVSERTSGKRAKTIKFGFVTAKKQMIYYSMKATDFRALMGNGAFRSTYITAIKKDTHDVTNIRDLKFHFHFVGFGHGVGMSQWGAYERSKAGIKYDDILSFYYPKTVLETPKPKLMSSVLSLKDNIVSYQYAIDKTATVFVDIIDAKGKRVGYFHPYVSRVAGSYEGSANLPPLNAGTYQLRIMVIHPSNGKVVASRVQNVSIKPSLPTFSKALQVNTLTQTTNAYTNRNKTVVAKKVYVSDQIKIIARYGTMYEVEHGGERVFVDQKMMKASKQSAIRITINGYQLTMDEKPRLVSGRTIVPIRFVGNGLGMKVSYNAKTRTATLNKSGKTIVLTVGKNIAYVNGKAVKLDARVQAYNGRMMLPIRFVSEQMGAYVDWDTAYRMVWIKQK